MQFYAITVDQLVYRFYFLMATVLFALFTGWDVLALLALPIFLSAMLGIRFRSPAQKRVATTRTIPVAEKVMEAGRSGEVKTGKVA